MARSADRDVSCGSSVLSGNASGSEDPVSGGMALALLASLPEHARILLIASPGLASVALRPIREGGVRFIRLHGLSRLPFRDASLDCVVLADRSGLSAGWRPPFAKRREILREIDRILNPQGQCVICVPRMWVPARRGWLSGVHPPLWFWLRAARPSGSSAGARALVRYEGVRLTEIFLTFRRASLKRRRLPRHAVLVLARSYTDTRPVALEGIVRAVALGRGLDRGGRPTRVERFLVRKIGKVIVQVALADGQRYLVRIPHSPVALERAGRNHAALSTLHVTLALPGSVKALVPRPIGHGHVEDYLFYVESYLSGRPSRQVHAHHREALELQAGRFIAELHALTRQATTVDPCCFERLVGGQVARIRRRCAGDQPLKVLGEIDRLLKERLVGATLPLCWNHGDFTTENCLFDEDGRLSGVVDWELFSEQGWPLIDLLQCVTVGPGTRLTGQWEPAVAVSDMLRDTKRLYANKVLREYVDRMGLAEAILPALLLLHWIDHVGNRIDARWMDREWFDRRVVEPLRMFGKVLCG